MVFHDEFELINRVKKSLGKPTKRVLLGIGDDAAVLTSPKGKLVATIDTMVENVHFDLAYTTPRELGHKALAVNLSDIAAMGAEPLYALVSIGLKQDTSEHFVDEFYLGMKALADLFDVDIVGGNTVQAPTAMIADVVLMGEASKKFITRSGAKAGDIVAVTGHLGASAAGLNILKKLGRDTLNTKKELLRAHLTPMPRIREAQKLLELGAVTSMIDISDGVSSEVHHLASQSKVGMWIDESTLPIAKSTLWGAEQLGANARLWALYGGEDYELLCTISPKLFDRAQKAIKKMGTDLTPIGQVRPAKEKILLKTTGGEWHPLAPRGWNHFVRRRNPLSR